MGSTSRHLIAPVAAMLGLLFVTTVLLGSAHGRVRAGRMQAHLERGDAFARQMALAAALEEYRAALSLAPEDPQARRSLALTLLSLDRFAEAETYIRDLLAENPTDGALNRALARIYAAGGRNADARLAYQRAIFGDWPPYAATERIDTRFELIDYLARLNAREERIAELLRLNAELPPARTAAARRVADLLIESGAPDMALETLATAAVTAPHDVELLAHLADLQLERGEYTAARATLRRALALDPVRSDLSLRLAVLDRVLALDPTLPRLRLVTRTRRARLVLAAVVEQTQACAADDAASGELRRVAATLLRPSARADAEVAEQALAIAAQLWTALPACRGTDVEARAIAQVIQRIEAASEPPS